MSIGENLRIGFNTVAQNSPYIYSPNVQNNRSVRTNSFYPNNIKQPIRDIFARQSQPNCQSTPQEFLSDIQNRFLTKFSPTDLVLKYTDKDFLDKAIKSNPQIASILAEHNLSSEPTPSNVTGIIKSHLLPTMLYAKEIMQKSGEYFSPADYEEMAQAALLHDIGKTLIPSEILNKKGKLTPQEREIVDLHSELGYEILKSTSINPRVLELIRTHHKSHSQSRKTQILTIADVYSALKEKRSYKEALPEAKAMAILRQTTADKGCNEKYISALTKSEQNNDQLCAREQKINLSNKQLCHMA